MAYSPESIYNAWHTGEKPWSALTAEERERFVRNLDRVADEQQ